MYRVSALVKRHPLATFFILAYALSWWAWILYALGVFPNPIASFGPFLAAIVVLALTEGKAGLIGLFRRMVRWRVAPGWYAVALLLPAVLTAVATVLNVMLGANLRSSAELGAWPGILCHLRDRPARSRRRRRMGGARLEGLRTSPVAAAVDPHSLPA